MFYTIYETTNVVSGKKYIGKHATEDPNDDYIGSGLVLRRAVQKWGRQNFVKKVLFVYDNELDMNAKEQELVNVDLVCNPMYYNAALGGQGGVIVLKPEHPLYESTCRKISEAQLARSADMSAATKLNHTLRRVGMYGKKQSDKQKRIVSEMQKGVPKKAESKEKQKASLLATLSSPGYIHPNKGRVKTSKELDGMRERSLNRPKKVCPHCSVIMDERNYARYHGEKCKHAKIQLEDQSK